MPHQTSFRFTLLLATTLALCVLWPAQSAFAQEDAKTLLKYAPEKSGAIVGMNLSKASSTTFYKEGLKMLKTMPEFTDALATMEKDLNLNLEKDIHAVVAVAPRPSSSDKTDDTVMIILSGKFDQKKILAKLTDEKAASRQVDKMTVYETGSKGEMTIISDELIVVIMGKESYRTDGFKTATASVKKSSAPKKLGTLTKRVNTSKHMWFVVDTSQATKSSPDQPAQVAMTFDFSSGLNMSGWVRMQNKEEAEKALAKFAENKAQFEGASAMVGAPSFAKNFKISAEKTDLTLSSSMPDKEVKSVATWGLGMLESSKRK